MNLRTIKLGLMHLDDCVDLDQQTLNGLWTKSQWKRELADPKRICLGAIEIETNELLGLCSAWLVIDELQITFLAVLPVHQRKGLGKFLLSDLIKRSKSLEINQIHLEVKDTNKSAKAFYKSMGFKIIGTRSNFFRDGSDALLLIKKLKNNP